MKKNLVTQLFSILIAAALIATVSGTAQAASDVVNFTGCGGGTVVAAQNAAYEQQVVDLTNQQRALVGAPPLKMTTALDNSARYHSADMVQDNYMQHDTYDRVNGNLVDVCAWSSRISSFYTSWSWLGENIAAGYGTPDAAVGAWMDDAPHRDNLLSANYWEIGVGYYSGSSTYGVYWTQDFGRRSGVYPLLINSDAASTDTRSVALYIYGAWTQMRLHNDNDAPGAWQPFKNSSNWQLDPGNGAHTVTAELTNGTASATSSDTIQLTGDKTPVLAGLPAASGFIYSISEHQLTPASLVFQPYDASLGLPLTWSIAQQGAWFSASPSSGTSPAIFTLTPGTFDQTQPGSYSGSVTVTVTNPLGAAGTPFTTQVSLTVVAGPLNRTYLPFAGH